MITFSRSEYDPSLQCQCNTECPQHSNCCPDYDQECGGGGGGSLSDADLLELSEMLIRSLIDYCLFVSNFRKLNLADGLYQTLLLCEAFFVES